MKRIGFLFAVMLLMAATHSNASADTLVFSQGFDAVNTDGIFGSVNGGSGVVKRAPSGFNGIILPGAGLRHITRRKWGPLPLRRLSFSAGGFVPQWTSTCR